MLLFTFFDSFGFVLTGHSNSFYYLPLILLTVKLFALDFDTKACSFFHGYLRECKKEQTLGVETVPYLDLCDISRLSFIMIYYKITIMQEMAQLNLSYVLVISEGSFKDQVLFSNGSV